jgi:hypothetical protein
MKKHTNNKKPFRLRRAFVIGYTYDKRKGFNIYYYWKTPVR